MSESLRTSKILGCKQEIMDYIPCSDHLFEKYVNAGMPARYDDGRWLAHADNIDEWFKMWTRVQMKYTPEKKETKK